MRIRAKTQHTDARVDQLVKHIAGGIAERLGQPTPQPSMIRSAVYDAELYNIAPTEWGRCGVLRFMAALFPERSGEMTRRREATARNLQSGTLADALSRASQVADGRNVPSVRSGIDSNIIRNADRSASWSPREHPFEMHHERNSTQYFVSIDSSDRDHARNPTPGDFVVELGRVDGGGILRSFRDVSSVELVSVIVPKHTVDGDNIDDYPYILLTIPELGGIYEATNRHAGESFAKLRFANDLGAYREYRTTDSGERFVKRFNPVRSMSRITLQFYRPDGVLYDFGTKVMRRPRYCNVTTVKKKKGKKRTCRKTPMYFDGEKWLPVENTPARVRDSKKLHTAGASPPDDNPNNPTVNPTHLDHLPDSNVSIVLRVTCTELKYNTTNLQRH